MKLLQTILLTITLCSSCVSGEQGAAKMTSIQLSEQSLDLGDVKINTEVEFDFEITNSGEYSLTIYRVGTSCGCTEVEWTQKIIRPQKSSVIKIKYKDKYPGFIRKTITVYGNIAKPVVVNLTGELIE